MSQGSNRALRLSYRGDNVQEVSDRAGRRVEAHLDVIIGRPRAKRHPRAEGRQAGVGIAGCIRRGRSALRAGGRTRLSGDDETGEPARSDQREHRER